MTEDPAEWPLRASLLEWYDEHRRDLPFRDAENAYMVWISEIMLQQTRVDTVVPYFLRWMELFPDVRALADATSDEVMKAWEGLGYYSRARNLHAAAKVISEELDGQIPQSASQLIRLPGIGPYTAGAIASIAYGLEEPLVDGNVIRVISRFEGLRGDVTRSPTKRAIWKKSGEMVRGPRPGDFNQALMELGATVCTPTSPGCKRCPLASACVARRESLQSEVPYKPRKNKPRREHRVALALENNGSWLLARRPDSGLLANLWEFPLVERLNNPREFLGFRLERPEQLADVTHVFSHIRMTVTPLHARLPGRPTGTPDGYAESVWVEWNSLNEFALSRLAQKVIAAVHSGQLSLIK